MPVTVEDFISSAPSEAMRDWLSCQKASPALAAYLRDMHPAPKPVPASRPGYPDPWRPAYTNEEPPW